MAEETDRERHMRRVEEHYDALGMDNPHASHFSSMIGNSGGSGGSAKERKGGLGSNKGAARYERTSAEDRATANSDGRYGYFDEANKRYVPAFFDAMDGGGFDTRGDTFKGGGPLSGILNDLGVNPYGSENERMFVSPNTSPIVQAVANSQNNADPRVLTSRGFAPSPEQLAPPAATAMNQNISPTNLPSDPIAQNPMIISVIQQARDLAARSGRNFDMMPQEMKDQFINAVMPLSNVPTTGV